MCYNQYLFGPQVHGAGLALAWRSWAGLSACWLISDGLSRDDGGPFTLLSVFHPAARQSEHVLLMALVKSKSRASPGVQALCKLLLVHCVCSCPLANGSHTAKLRPKVRTTHSTFRREEL